jgi:hypothetical protein
MSHPYAEETVYVKADNERGYKLVSKEKFEAEDSDYKLYSGKIDGDTKTIKDGKLLPNDQPENPNQSVGGNTKNPSGTFSTPTPTDIRYSDKFKTEFENNMGAFIGKSAAQIRDALNLPDAPGGLHPVASLALRRSGNKSVLVDSKGAEWVSMTRAEADKYEQMSDDEKLAFVAMRRRDDGKIDKATLTNLGASPAMVEAQTSGNAQTGKDAKTGAQDSGKK